MENCTLSKPLNKPLAKFSPWSTLIRIAILRFLQPMSIAVLFKPVFGVEFTRTADIYVRCGAQCWGQRENYPHTHSHSSRDCGSVYRFVFSLFACLRDRFFFFTQFICASKYPNEVCACVHGFFYDCACKTVFAKLQIMPRQTQFAWWKNERNEKEKEKEKRRCLKADHCRVCTLYSLYPQSISIS